MSLIHKKGQQGVSLIEVMVAVFVLAVGILGIIGLQLLAKQNSYDAIQRTTASWLATTIIERMRANPSALDSYAGSLEPITMQVPGLPDRCTAPCSPEQIAEYDLAYWQNMLVGAAQMDSDNVTFGGLIAPSACITVEPVTGDDGFDVTVAIAWRGRSAIGDPLENDCGVISVDSPYGDSNEFRRVMWIDARILE